MSGPERLVVRDFGIRVPSAGGAIELVEGVEFDVARGKTVALVGESGSGKTVTALALAGFLPPEATLLGAIEVVDSEGRVESLAAAAPTRWTALRGRVIGTLFQEPLLALHPALRVLDQVAEAVSPPEGRLDRATRAAARALLQRVGFPSSAAAARAFPHELSGGQRQRVLLAVALAASPSFLIADEPTTALDPPLAAEFLGLLDRLRSAESLGVLLVSHDLARVSGVADEVVVLYAGRVVERGPARAVLDAPRHPYTLGLVASLPKLSRPGRLPAVLPGFVPPPSARPSGCVFAPRCGFAEEACRRARPPLAEVGDGRRSACPPVVEGRLGLPSPRDAS